MPNSINNRVRYTRQSIVTNTFYQTPRFLTAGEFAGSRMTNNARVLYTLLLDRHRISIKNNWFDDSGEVYIYFKREEMEAQLGLSERTVSKVMQELKDLSLVEEKKQGLNKPNKIYLLSPIVGDDENPDPYLDPDYTEPEITAPPDAQDLRPVTRKSYASDPAEDVAAEPVKSTVQDPQDFGANDNKLNNNKKSYNDVSDNEMSATAVDSRGGGDTPYSQILEMYNGLCETRELRTIRSISGKRKSQTAARFKEYGLDGFVDLFEKVSASSFLCGGGDRGWKVDFDWLVAPTNMQKVLEGKYDGNQSNVPLQQPHIFGEYPHKNTERHDPFMERAMMAYETAANTAI